MMRSSGQLRPSTLLFFAMGIMAFLSSEVESFKGLYPRELLYKHGSKDQFVQLKYWPKYRKTQKKGHRDDETDHLPKDDFLHENIVQTWRGPLKKNQQRNRQAGNIRLQDISYDLPVPESVRMTPNRLQTLGGKLKPTKPINQKKVNRKAKHAKKAYQKNKWFYNDKLLWKAANKRAKMQHRQNSRP